MARHSLFKALLGSRRIALLAALVVFAVVSGLPFWGALQSHVLPDRVALRQALERPELAFMQPAYAARDFKPAWMDGKRADPAAQDLIETLETSGRDGLSPGAYAPEILRRRVEELPYVTRRDRIRTELLLSSAYTRYIRDLHTPAPSADLIYTDPELQPKLRDPAAIMGYLAGSRTPREALRRTTPMNGLYAQMRAALARHREGERVDPTTEALLLLNLDRLRALPSDLGRRFVLVDAASSRLWLYEGSRPVDSMKVVVGSPAQQTPQMGALIRYAIFNPYWNVPPDLTRDNFASRIRADRSALDDLRMDAWSDFTAKGVKLDPAQLDWDAVAQGRTLAWLRQRPGPDNAMGNVKFMMPNHLGIYLHDTPRKDLFSLDQRDLSAGCVRVEDAKRLSRWLYEGAEVAPRGPAPEQRFNLPKPVPVYLVYLTAWPEAGVIRLQRDGYGRDWTLPPAWMMAPLAAGG